MRSLIQGKEQTVSSVSPTKSLNEFTPYEALSGVKPSVSHLKVFGYAAYAHISKEEQRKLDSKAKKCILLGYGTDVKGYHLYSPQERNVFYSRDVVLMRTTAVELRRSKIKSTR